ncbi:hypothetical protein GCM10010278_36910 [Streptomyces melanogenes]|nr:hypothetical protein GCM10010278_36910 [Streptomyces melanogenes]
MPGEQGDELGDGGVDVVAAALDEPVGRRRDDLIDECDTARARVDAQGTEDLLRPDTSRRDRHWFGHRAARR